MNSKNQIVDEDNSPEKSENLERYSFTLPSSLVDGVDKLSQSLKMNRSQIVREAVANWIQENTKKLDMSGTGIGISSYIYNHHDSRVVSDIMNIQHEFDD